MRIARVAVVLFLVPACGVALGAWFLLRTQVWEGEMPAVVASTYPDRMYVDLVGPPRPGMLPGSGVLPRHLRADLLPGAVQGDRVTCLVRQTYQVNTNLDTGARTTVLSCR